MAAAAPIRRAAGPALAGVAALVAVAFLPPVRFLERPVPADLRLYESFGGRMADGEVPYRDFSVEYPPGAVPVFAAPAVAGDYPRAFRLLALGLACACAALLALLAAAAGGGAVRVYAAALSVAPAALLLRQVFFDRYDLWPAALLLGALAALALGARRAGFGLLGLAAAAKVYPAAALPAALAFARTRVDRRTAARDLVPAVVAAGLVTLPFALLGPGGLAHSALQQVRRPLQVESLGGSLLLAADRLGLREAEVVSSYGSQNVAGSAAVAVALLTGLAQLAAIGGVAVLYARGDRNLPRLLAAAAAAVVAFAAFNKVLSPQYMTWLAAAVPLAGGLVLAPALALAWLAFALTQLWFPDRYGELVAVGPAVWLAVARNLVLVGLFALLALNLARTGPR